MSIRLKKKSEKTRREDQLLEELGFGQADVCDVPRSTNGIMVIPVKTTKELFDKSYVFEAKSDEEGTKYFTKFEPKPDKVMRLRNMYYADAPEIPDYF